MGAKNRKESLKALTPWASNQFINYTITASAYARFTYARHFSQTSVNPYPTIQSKTEAQRRYTTYSKSHS